VADVIAIDAHQRASFAASGSMFAASEGTFAITASGQALQKHSDQVLTPQDLYRDLDYRDGYVVEALQLLKECAGHLTAATHADPAADFVEYDEQIMRASERLRRLFALREIGDGFGATINALLWALQNQLGERLTAKQLSNLLDVIDQLRKRPMLHFDSSMRLLDQLEDSCLNIEPPGLDLLSLQNE